MISAATPPGTEVVCVNDAPGPYGAGDIRKGEHYIVDHIEKSITGDYCVILTEIAPWRSYDISHGVVNVGFDLRRFRYLEDLSLLERLLTHTEKKLEKVA